MKSFDELYQTSKTASLGRISPWSVNVVTYSGHGITYEGDAVAIIPQKTLNPETKTFFYKPRFINMSGFARKLASNDFSVNIFLMSMCRLIHRYGNNDESYLQQLNEDTQSSEAKYEGYKKSGFSVMIFDCSNGNPAVDGSLIRKFMEKL